MLAGAATAGSLTIGATLTYIGGPDCADCRGFSAAGHGAIRGLGAVQFTATGTTDTTDPSCGKSTEQFVVTTPGKGTFTLDGTVQGCSTPFSVTFNRTTIDFTATGGTGRLSGMTGSGSISSNGTAIQVTGTLNAPSFTFDLTAPAFRGAVNRTAKASSAAGARVHFSVSAVDSVEGSVKSSCDHPSGSIFRIGKTRVTCSAADASANVGHASFLVKVTR